MTRDGVPVTSTNHINIHLYSISALGCQYGSDKEAKTKFTIAILRRITWMIKIGALKVIVIPSSRQPVSI